MIPALIVGLLTAWYLGFRIGLIVAAVTAVALLVANFVPGLSITIYVLVLGWAALLYFFGSKIQKVTGKSSMLGSVGGPIAGGVGQATAWVKKLFGDKKS